MTSLEVTRRIIGKRVPGPFNESGLPGARAFSRIDTAARNYEWNRRVRGMGAAKALQTAAPIALQPHTVRSPQWYGKRGGAGAVFKEGGDSLRWFESTDDSGLRFVAWADDLPGGPDHTGWYTTQENWAGETLRGGVWQLPGRKGSARLVYGYAEFQGRGEMNPGSAAICVSDIVAIDRGGEDSAYEGQEDSEEMRDLARWADGLAESAAESRRDYDSAYQEGRQAGESDNAALEARKEALGLAGDMKGRFPRPARHGAAWAALVADIAGLLETISEKRAARDSSWGNVYGVADTEAWRAGFCDESSGGFRRAVRLGYASPADWGGPADRNPCNGEAGQ